MPLSPHYLPLRRLSAALSWGLLAALFVTPVFLFVDRTTALVVAGGFLAVLGWRVIRQGALVRAWGFLDYFRGKREWGSMERRGFAKAGRTP